MKVAIPPTHRGENIRFITPDSIVAARVMPMPENTRSTPQFCTRCGSPLTKRGEFCTHCGAPVPAQPETGNSMTTQPIGSLTLNQVFTVPDRSADLEWEWGWRLCIWGAIGLVVAIVAIFITPMLGVFFGFLDAILLVAAFGFLVNDYLLRRHELALVLAILIAGLIVITNLANLPMLVVGLVMMAIAAILVRGYREGQRAGET